MRCSVLKDVEEIPHISLLRDPESQAVLNASNKGAPVIFDEAANLDAGMAYNDTVERLLQPSGTSVS